MLLAAQVSSKLEEGHFRGAVHLASTDESDEWWLINLMNPLPLMMRQHWRHSGTCIHLPTLNLLIHSPRLRKKFSKLLHQLSERLSSLFHLVLQQDQMAFALSTWRTSLSLLAANDGTSCLLKALAIFVKLVVSGAHQCGYVPFSLEQIWLVLPRAMVGLDQLRLETPSTVWLKLCSFSD